MMLLFTVSAFRHKKAKAGVRLQKKTKGIAVAFISFVSDSHVPIHYS